MSRNWDQRLQDIRWACTNILEFTDGFSQTDFVRDKKTFWATVKMIEIVGEAARNTPVEIQEQFPEVLWANLTATRNVFVHTYFGLDDDILWDIVQVDIPELLQQPNSHPHDAES